MYFVQNKTKTPLYFVQKRAKTPLYFVQKILLIMKRDIYKALINWKNSNNRRPLLIRGARQIGKTFIIKEFGTKEFSNFIILNFERNPELKSIFNNYNPKDILEKIALFTGKKINLGTTLLFLDEIQDCPKAIMSLRYFYEELPELHILGAGSLLEFSLNAEGFRTPVGRIEYIYMKPMSFGEFLDAKGKGNIREYLKKLSNIKNIPEVIHNELNKQIRKYFMLGGMPAVVQEYVNTQDILKCQKIQHALINTFIEDFAKYARVSKYPYLKKVFNAIPMFTGNKFVYSNVDKTTKSRELKQAVELLEQAGIIHRVKRTNATGLPLEAGVKDNFFKLIFLDIGLMHALSGIYTETARQEDFTAIFNGAVAEQFVGQEIIAYQTHEIKPNLYYWAREARNSNAEIDYLIAINTNIIPIEVKSGKKGTLKSLLLFIEKYKTTIALKISQAKYRINEPITNLPFYSIESFLENYEF